jgi:hypothetical protein
MTRNLDEVGIAPCPDCNTDIETRDVVLMYDRHWNSLGLVSSATRCPDCQPAFEAKKAAEEAERVRNAAIAEAKREEIRRRVEAAKPIERQIGFELFND